MLLIDTYNVLHTTGILPPALAGPDLRDLVRLLAGSRYATRPIVLVCDGGMHHFADIVSEVGLAVQVVYAGPGAEADHVLEDYIAHDTAPHHLIVVSSDRRVQRAARSRAATPVRSEDFLRQLLDDRARKDPLPDRPQFATAVPLGQAGTDYWLRYFGLAPGSAGATPLPPDPPVNRPALPPPKPATPPRLEPARSGHRLSLPRPPQSPPPPVRSEPFPRDTPILWGQGLGPDDLDMERWLRLRPPPPAPPKPPGPPLPGARRSSPSRRGPGRGGL